MELLTNPYISSKNLQNLKHRDSIVYQRYTKTAISAHPCASYSGSPLFNLSNTSPTFFGITRYSTNNTARTLEEFSKFIKAHTIQDEIIVSFDVEAIYSNVPIEDAPAIIKELLKNDNNLSVRMPLITKELAGPYGFLLHTAFFVSNGTYYEQVGKLRWEDHLHQ